MIGKLFINGKDAWATWGVFLEDGSEASLLLPPPNKTFTENKFRSQPGKQLFAINPQPDERDLQLVFCISAIDKRDYLRKQARFVAELNKGIIEFKVLSTLTVYRLTALSYVDLVYYDRLGKLAVKFNEPNPKDRESTLRTAFVLISNEQILTNENNELLTQNIK